MRHLHVMSDPHAQQRGAVLVISLIILLVLTLLGLSGMRTATLEERMAGNMRDRNLAFQAAESALREAEDWLKGQSSFQQTAGSTFVYAANANPQPTTQSHTWWTNATNTASYGINGSAAIAQVSTQPRFFITEGAFVKDNLEMNSQSGTQYFVITARGTGGTDSAESILQTTYAKRYN